MTFEREPPDPFDLFKAIFYGPAGHGKTHIVGTAVADYVTTESGRMGWVPRGDETDFWPALLIDFEAGLKSIGSLCRPLANDELGEVDPEPGTIDVVRIYDITDFDLILSYLQSDDSYYNFVAIDSCSELNYLSLQAAIDINVAKSSGTTGSRDPDLADRQDYLRSAVHMRRLVRHFRDLETHTLLTAGVVIADDPITRLQKMQPNLTGRLAQEVPGLFDVIGYLGVVEEDEGSFRTLCVQPTTRFYAKARDEFGCLGDAVDNPTLPKLWSLLHGEEVDDEEDWDGLGEGEEEIVLNDDAEEEADEEYDDEEEVEEEESDDEEEAEEEADADESEEDYAADDEEEVEEEESDDEEEVYEEPEEEPEPEEESEPKTEDLPPKRPRRRRKRANSKK